MNLIIEFSGYIYVNENSRFLKVVYHGNKDSQPAIISTKEYLTLEQSARNAYVIENITDAIREADDYQYYDARYCIEEDM